MVLAYLKIYKLSIYSGIIRPHILNPARCQSTDLHSLGQVSGRRRISVYPTVAIFPTILVQPSWIPSNVQTAQKQQYFSISRLMLFRGPTQQQRDLGTNHLPYQIACYLCTNGKCAVPGEHCSAPDVLPEQAQQPSEHRQTIYSHEDLCQSLTMLHPQAMTPSSYVIRA
jgi:hypothetical protein